VSTLSAGQIYALARNAGLSPATATTATAVALAESGGRTDAMGDVGLEDGTWGPSVGLWQIRSLKAQQGTGQVRDASRLTDPAFNAAAMASISGAGKNFKPWSTYTSGKWANFLQTSGNAAISAGDDPLSSHANPLTEAGASLLNSIGLGGATSAGTAVGQAVAGMTSGWGTDALSISLRIVGALAAAGLVIVGAVHTVSSKGT
jgi:hypothetical protein